MLEITKRIWDSLPKEDKRRHRNGDTYVAVRRGDKKEWVQCCWRS